VWAEELGDEDVQGLVEEALAGVGAHDVDGILARGEDEDEPCVWLGGLDGRATNLGGDAEGRQRVDGGSDPREKRSSSSASPSAAEAAVVGEEVEEEEVVVVVEEEVVEEVVVEAVGASAAGAAAAAATPAAAPPPPPPAAAAGGGAEEEGRVGSGPVGVPVAVRDGGSIGFHFAGGGPRSARRSA